MSMMTALADSGKPDSLASRLRAARFRRFEALTETLAMPLRVLDVGGTNLFWERNGWAGRTNVSITLVNLHAEARKHSNITSLAGDATDLSRFADSSFDIAFSNSTIEHLGGFTAQERMASEMRRVAHHVWVQTPNFWFPIEPHFCVPAWQWIPIHWRVALLRKFRFGWIGPCKDQQEARAMVNEIRLITRKDLRRLFPNARLVPERFGGLIKSWTAIEGF
jgi:hypothetical protein